MDSSSNGTPKQESQGTDQSDDNKELLTGDSVNEDEKHVHWASYKRTSERERGSSPGAEGMAGPTVAGGLQADPLSPSEGRDEVEEEEKADDDAAASLVVRHDGRPSEDRWTDGQNKESTAGASQGVAQDPADSASVLHSILVTMNDVSKALQTLIGLQESTTRGVQGIESEARQTSNLMFTLTELLREQKHTHSGGGNQNTKTVNQSFNGLGLANVANVHFDISAKDGDNSTLPNSTSPINVDTLYQEKEQMGFQARMEDIWRQKRMAKREKESEDPELVKCVEDPLHEYMSDPHYRPQPVPENASKENKGGSKSGHGRRNNSSAPDHSGQAQDTRAERSGAGSRMRQGASPPVGQHTRTERSGAGSRMRQGASPPVGQHTTKKKGKAEGSISEEESDDDSQSPPLNIPRPVDRSSSSARPPDVRPKDPRFSTSRTFPHRNRISAHTLTIDSDSGSESQRLSEALERARAPDPNPPPKARSYDTVLCLDTSESMLQENAFKEMVNIAKEFIDGVEDMTSDVEENIGLVTFGGRANIIQHLTNDFSLIREALQRIEFGGTSPFFEAIVVCLGAFDGKGGTVSVSGEYEVHPRIIFLTDGHITEGSDDPIDRVIDATNTRARFTRLMMDLSPKKDPSMPHPIIFVPVGTHADQKFLRSMAELNDGQVIEPENLTSICNYYKIQETIGKVIVCMRNMNTEDTSDNQIEAVVLALVPNIDKQEMDEVKAAVCREMQNPSRKRGRSDPTAFDDVHEDKEGVEANERLPLGTRVVRGPDWRWDNQDNKGPGTVVQHEDKKHGFTWVVWDEGGNRNRYPYGSEMGFHVWKTDDHPVQRTRDESLKIGMVVKKGPNWDNPHMKFDAEPGSIIRVSRDRGLVKVRWSNGKILSCPATAVEYCDPFGDVREVYKQEEETAYEYSTKPEWKDEDDEDGSKVPVWQWRDDWGNWRLYSREETQRLEAAYQRKRNGSCILQRENKQLRILFQRRTEKDLDKHTERDIHRTYLAYEELQSLEVAEELMSNR